MAIFPQGKTRARERCNAGEKRVLDALDRCLEDDYTVWHNISIMGSGNEPDFVILHPSRGLLVLEVKDWKRSTIVDANTMLVKIDTPMGIKSTDHPVSQALGYVLKIVNLLQKHPALLQTTGIHAGNLCVPWGHGAVLSHIRRDEVLADESFSPVFEPRNVMLRDDLDENVEVMAFQERLWGMFRVSWRTSLTLPQMGIVRGLLFPELRISNQLTLSLDGGGATKTQSQGAKLIVNDVLQVMDLHQEEVARALGDGHRVVHGPAGSGKTMILIFRAMQLQAAARADKPILVLCYNASLAGRINMLLRAKGAGAEIVVRTFHSWAQELIRTYQLAPLATLNSRNYKDDENYYAALTAVACQGIATHRVPKGQYTAILIDEAHDLQEDWLRAAAQMVDPESKSLLVLYDDAQSIYQKKRAGLSFAKLGIEAQGRTKILKVNYRNTTEVLALALDCACELFQPTTTVEKELAVLAIADEEQIATTQPESGGRSGPKPIFLQTRDAREEAKSLVELIMQECAKGRNLNDMAIFSRAKKNFKLIEDALQRADIPFESQEHVRPSDMNWLQPSIKLLTLHSAKGLEFGWVAVACLDTLPQYGCPLIDELRLLYVGMTRATHQLVLTAAGVSEVTKRVVMGLQKLDQ